MVLNYILVGCPWNSKDIIKGESESKKKASVKYGRREQRESINRSNLESPNRDVWHARSIPLAFCVTKGNKYFIKYCKVWMCMPNYQHTLLIQLNLRNWHLQVWHSFLISSNATSKCLALTRKTLKRKAFRVKQPQVHDRDWQIQPNN